MVLRGSNIRPPTNLGEAEYNLREAQAALVQAKNDFEDAQKAVFHDFTEESVKQLSKSELLKLVDDLQKKLNEKEFSELSAEMEASKARTVLMNTFKQLACGGAAGAIARSTVAPIDRVKIAMQTAHLKGPEAEAQHSGIVRSIRTIVAQEGLAGLWRGNLTNCVRVGPHTAVQFTSYDWYKALLVTEGSPNMSIQQRLLAGALSGMTAATVTHPMDVIRIRLQTESSVKNVTQAIKHIYAENGLRTFYKGYTPAMISLSPFIAINFATMDTLKKLYFGKEDSELTKKELQKRNPFSILMLGAVAGIFAQTVCYPLDTIRRRMQVSGKNYSSTINCITTITKQEGIGGFYKGMTANALKVVPNNAIRFAVFDVLKSIFLKQAADDVKFQDLSKRQAELGKILAK